MEGSGYGLVGRFVALREVLRRGRYSKDEIFHRLPRHYQAGAAGSRRLGRDISALRQLGYSIEFDRSAQTYQLKETPLLALDDQAVQTLALIRESFEALPPKAGEVLEVLQSILAALPERQHQLFYRESPVAIRLRPATDYRPYAKTIRLLEKAVGQGSKVRFVYPSLDENAAEPHVGVEPYEIQFFDRQFYLLGFSPLYSHVLEFRLDRITDLELMPDRLAFRRKRSTIVFTYRLSERVARLGVSERFINQRVTPQMDGSVIVQAEGYSEFRIIQDVLRYGEQAEILGPPGLRAKMAQVTRAMSRLYSKGSDK